MNRPNLLQSWPLLLCMGLKPAESVPWPYGQAPTDLPALTDFAVKRGDEDRLLEFSSSLEDQQEVEIVGILQRQLDTNAFDRDVLHLYGHKLFQMPWRRDLGLGGQNPDLRLQRVHGDGGLDSHSCDGCHLQGGQDGAGSFGQSAFLDGDGDALSSANIRNPPALLGLGLVQELGWEMTQDLATQRSRAIEEARVSQTTVTVKLLSKDQDFGQLVVTETGTVDTGGLRGVATDLVVRPFGWKGQITRLRRFVEDAALTHFGVQSTVMEAGQDRDGDGKTRELEEGALSYMAIYLERLEVPVILPPTDPALLSRWNSGQNTFSRIGCDACHVPMLPMQHRFWQEQSDTTGATAQTVELLKEGETPRGNDQIRLYSDLRRHAMGTELADPHPNLDGIPPDVFLTRPLWGLAETAPYLHDGRALTIPEAIRAHGGEAAASQAAYLQLPVKEQEDLLVFLLSLSRSPKPRISR